MCIHFFHLWTGMFTALLPCKFPEILGDSPNQNAVFLLPEFNEIPANVNQEDLNS